MDQSQRSVITTLFQGDDGLRDLIDRKRLMALVAVLVGLSQLLLAVATIPPKEDSLVLFVVGTSGWLLIGIAINLFRGKEAFESGWESERITWLMTVIALLVAIGVAAAAVSVSFGMAWLGTVVTFISILAIGGMIVALVWWTLD